MRNFFIILLITIIAVPLSAQDLDLNNLSNGRFYKDVEPLARVMPALISGPFSSGGKFLDPWQFRINAWEGITFPEKNVITGPLDSVESIGIPFFELNIGLDPRLELIGKFAASTIGNRNIVVSGYGVRYQVLESKERHNLLTFGALINSMTGPEDFRIFDITVQSEFIIFQEESTIEFFVGTDFSEMRIGTDTGGNITSYKSDKLERTRFWFGAGFNRNINDSLTLSARYQRHASVARLIGGISFIL